MNFNKSHWYDGWFYDTFIAPNQNQIFASIKKLIEPNSTVLDVGCGTGRFSFTAADKCRFILGIDLSLKNILRANANIRKKPNPKISFKHTTVEDLVKQELHFDLAVLTYVIHELNETERVKLLLNISKLADNIIVGDYHPKQTNKTWKLLNEIVEFLAGKEHYTNYKSYIKNGGIKTLVEKTNLKIICEMKDSPITSHLLFLRSN